MTARRWLAFLSAAFITAVAAVLAVMLPVTIASAQTVPAAGNGVGAPHPQMILAVGSSRPVLAGEGRCEGLPQPGFVSGLCAAAEGNNQGNMIYREGRTNPSNLTPRPSDQGLLSFRNSLSNPYPLPEGQRPVFRPGQPYFGIDTSQLPEGSVIYDNVPPGHVSVEGVPPDVLKAAVTERGSFPDEC